MRTCGHCGGEMPTTARRHAQTCSTRCRVAAHRARRPVIPTELTSRPRWVRYSPKKVPLQPGCGRPASSTDRRTWSAYAAARASRIGAGAGFVLDGDGIVCLDLDHCIDEHGELSDVAARILAQAGATYVEVSPSGRGLHVWGRGKVPYGRRMVVDGQPVEAYGRGRYITVTGRPAAGSVPSLADLQPLLDDLLTHGATYLRT